MTPMYPALAQLKHDKEKAMPDCSPKRPEMTDPITAHGWTHNPAPGFVDLTYAGESVVIFTDAHIVDDAVDDLVHCIEDSARLTEARRLAEGGCTVEHLLVKLGLSDSPEPSHPTGPPRTPEDAALLAEARRLAAHAIGGVDIVDCAGSIANLLALLTGETTHDG